MQRGGFVTKSIVLFGGWTMEQKKISFTRQQLYDQVWSIPMIKFAEKHPNVSKMNGMLHFDSISDDHLAYVQSMEFIEYFYETESDGNTTEELVDNEEKEEADVELEHDSD